MISLLKWPTDPAPTVPTRTLPGLRFAKSTISLKLLYGASERTVRMLGVRVAIPSGVKSLNGS